MLYQMFVQAKEWFKYLSVQQEEKGQGLVEYALIVVLISVVAIAIMTTVGTDIQSVFQSVSTALGAAVAPGNG